MANSYLIRLSTKILFVFTFLLLYQSDLCRSSVFVVPNAPHAKAVTGVLALPGGHLFVTASLDHTIKIWNLQTAKVVKTISLETAALSLTMRVGSPGFAVGGQDGRLRLYDEAGQLERVITPSREIGPLSSLSFLVNGTQVAFASRGPVVGIFDFSLNRPIRLFQYPGERVDAVVTDPKGQFVVAGGTGNVISLWNYGQEESPIWSKKVRGRVTSLKISEDGQHIFLGGCHTQDNTETCGAGFIQILEVSDGTILRELGGHTHGVSSFLFLESTGFISGGWDGSVILWSGAGNIEATLRSELGAVNSLDLSPDGSLLLVGATEGISILRLPQGSLVRKVANSNKAVSALALSKRRNSILFNNSQNAICFFDPRSGRPKGKFVLGYEVTSLATSQPESTLIVGSRAGAISSLDLESGEERGRWPAHQGRVNDIKIMTDFDKLISAGNDTTIKVWEKNDVIDLFRPPEEDAVSVNAIALSPDGNFVASAGAENIVRIWTFGNKLSQRLLGHTKRVNAIEFSAHERGFASASSDGYVILWDILTGRPLHYFAIGASATSLGFFPESSKLAVGTAGGTIKILDLQTRTLLRSIRTASGSILKIIVHNQQIITSTSDGIVGLYNQTTGDEVKFYGDCDKNWLTITHAGFFSGQGDFDDQLSVVNDLQIYSVSQFYEHLYRPDLVEELLKGDPWGKYKDAASKLNLETILNSGSAPKLELLEKRTERLEDRVKLAVRIKDAGGGIGGKVVWRVDGKTQGDLSAPGLQAPPSPGRAVVMSQTLQVDPGKTNIIEVTAYNGQGLLASLPLRITVDPFGVTTTERPKLHVLAAGVDKYAMKDLELRYAVKDATAFAEAMQSVGSTLFSEVRITLLHDGNVTRSGLEAAVNKLAGEVKPTDVFVLFLSGHGRSIAGKYYYLQQDLEFAKGHSVEHDAIGQELWQQWLAKIPAQKTLLIYDTCESAAASGLVKGGQRERETAMEQLQHATGHNLIAAAGQAAYEGYQGHGVLTFAILEAFQKLEIGGAEVQKVDVDGLAGYVGDRVPEITKLLFGQRQEPLRKLAGNNFPLGLKILASPPASECPAAEDFIIIKNESLRDNIGDPASSDRKLAPGYRVGAKFFGSWALICRDGAKLGYVQQESLLKTN